MPGVIELQQIASRVAAQAGELIKRRRAEGVEVAASKSSPEDIVTLADRESEDLIRGLLSDARPDDAFLGEEGGGADGTSGLTWVVDPIDGTVNFLYGIPDYAVSISVVEGKPDPLEWTNLAGAVYAPARDEMFVAAAGQGAYWGTKRLEVNRAVRPNLALVGTGFSYSAERRIRQLDVVRSLIGEVRDIRRIGSAALDLCAVATGRMDAYFERGLNPWDLAAGSLIAAEAGARVGGLGADAPSTSMTIAAEPELFEFLQAKLEALGNE